MIALAQIVLDKNKSREAPTANWSRIFFHSEIVFRAVTWSRRRRTVRKRFREWMKGAEDAGEGEQFHVLWGNDSRDPGECKRPNGRRERMW
ncbi:protein of unknown function [Kyrpidia spormannii]|uniref:Uncharacterized protein n=2 Tax=Kyrpidia spormannii TaxID=2055160 RepID=A0ACA8Z630_9BACL|nr:protein of unknown function [Kyrpidia spormannii]CAB3390860.1 protein of unknown function [Kyrpidia spormannii]